MQKKNKKIIISDATLRDGNHAIRHQIDKQQIEIYCKAAEKAGIDIVEVGHGNGVGASSIQVGLSNLSDLKMLKTSRKFLKKTKLGVHIIPGFATIQDIKMALDLGVDVFRVASHCTESDLTQKHIEFIRRNNRKAFGVLMMSHMASKETLLKEAKKMKEYGAQCVVLMDSAGAYIPKNVSEKVSFLKKK